MSCVLVDRPGILSASASYNNNSGAANLNTIDNLTSATGPPCNVTSYQWNSVGLMTQQTDANSHRRKRWRQPIIWVKESSERQLGLRRQFTRFNPNPVPGGLNDGSSHALRRTDPAGSL